MRLAITGTSGIGKTTLARHLADRLGIPLLAENFGPLVAVSVALRKGLADPERRPSLEENWRRQAAHWLRQRQLAQQNTPRFVADRCGFDVLNRWLLADLAHQRPQLLQRLIQECRQQSADLDLIVVPPLMAWSLQEGSNEAGLVRETDLNRKVLSHSLLIGLLQQYSRAPVMALPPACASTEERGEEVLRWLTARRKTAPVTDP